MSRMDKIVKLIHELDNELLSADQKFEEVKYFRDAGVITTEEAVDLITSYGIEIRR